MSVGRPKETLQGIFDFFDNHQNEETIEGIVNGEFFNRYAKDPRYSYNNEMRLADKAKLKSSITAEISEARSWITRHLDACPIPERLASALSGDTPILLE